MIAMAYLFYGERFSCTEEDIISFQPSRSRADENIKGIHKP